MIPVNFLVNIYSIENIFICGVYLWEVDTTIRENQHFILYNVQIFLGLVLSLKAFKLFLFTSLIQTQS